MLPLMFSFFGGVLGFIWFIFGILYVIGSIGTIFLIYKENIQDSERPRKHLRWPW